MAGVDLWMNELRVIDGGMGTAAADLCSLDIYGHKLYSSRLLVDAPHVVKNIHKAFLEAGADILETNTYQASVAGFINHLGIPETEAIALFHKSVQLARSACQSLWPVLSSADPKRPFPLVAGSIGPYGGHLTDLSEYSGSYMDTVSLHDLKNWHRPQIGALLGAKVDFLAIDTIPAIGEAVAIAELLRDEFPNAKCWISFSSPLDATEGGKTCRGEPLADAAIALKNYPNVFGIGVNCVAPSLVAESLRSLQAESAAAGKLLLVYPNSGEGYNQKEWYYTEQQPAERNQIEDLIPEWLELGARWIGGCCRVNPSQLAHISTLLQRRRNRIP